MRSGRGSGRGSSRGSGRGSGRGGEGGSGCGGDAETVDVLEHLLDAPVRVLPSITPRALYSPIYSSPIAWPEPEPEPEPEPKRAGPRA